MFAVASGFLLSIAFMLALASGRAGTRVYEHIVITFDKHTQTHTLIYTMNTHKHIVLRYTVLIRGVQVVAVAGAAAAGGLDNQVRVCVCMYAFLLSV